MAGPQFAGKADGAGNVDAGRAAKAQTLFLDQVENDRKRFLVGHLEGKVRSEAVKIGGDASLADAFRDRASISLQFTAGVEGVQCGAERIGERDLDVPALGFQSGRDTGQRATRADSRYETVNLAASLRPDLLCRRADMAVAVGDIVELVGPDGTVRFAPRHLFGQTPGQFHIVVGVFVGNRRNFDQLGAQ